MELDRFAPGQPAPLGNVVEIRTGVSPIDDGKLDQAARTLVIGTKVREELQGHAGQSITVGGQRIDDQQEVPQRRHDLEPARRTPQTGTLGADAAICLCLRIIRKLKYEPA